MGTVSVSFQIDEEVIKQAQEAFESMGLNMTEALMAFIKATLRLRRIPFELVADDFAAEKSKRQQARRELEGFAGTLKRNVDIKEERSQWRDERYGDIH